MVLTDLPPVLEYLFLLFWEYGSYITGNIACTVMCSALAGGLISFFYYNVFSKKNKIFLGDTGSLTIGLVLGVLVVRFLQLEQFAEGSAVIEPAPAFAVSLFILPFLILFGSSQSVLHRANLLLKPIVSIFITECWNLA